MLTDTSINIDLGTYLLYIIEEIREILYKSRSQGRCIHTLSTPFPTFGGATEACYSIY